MCGLWSSLLGVATTIFVKVGMDVTGEEEWSDWEDEDIPAQSLFEEKMLSSAKARIVLSCYLELLANFPGLSASAAVEALTEIISPSSF